VNIKSKIAGSTPYVGVFGYFNGPEVNRVLFSFHKMNKLLQYKKTETEINSIAKSVIFISDKDKKIIKNLRLPGNYIAIALGGEWSYRTYKKWKIVIQKIIENHNGIKIVLLGSKNANYFASEIENNFSNKYIHNCVNKHTFVQTAEIINKANLLLCCDGGLMHAANSVDTPIVALFAKLSQTMQLTSSISAFSLYDNSDVNNIKPTEIFSKFLEASNFFHIDHQDG
jgi:heptosyltransferase-2